MKYQISGTWSNRQKLIRKTYARTETQFFNKKITFTKFGWYSNSNKEKILNERNKVKILSGTKNLEGVSVTVKEELMEAVTRNGLSGHWHVYLHYY